MRRFSAGLTHDFRIAEDVRLRTLLYGSFSTDDAWHQLYDRAPVPNQAYTSIVGDTTMPGGALYLRDANRMDAQQFQVFGIEPRLQAVLRVARFRNEIDIGARFIAERTNATVLVGSSQVARSGNVMHDEIREGYAFSAYLQDRVFLTDELQVTPAIRVESYSYSRTYRRDQFADLNVSGGGTTPLGVIPAATVSYVTRWIVPFADVRMGYAPARVTQAVEPTIPPPNQTVVPVQSIQYEVGARSAIGNWFRAEAAGFYIDLQNPLTYGPLIDTPLYGWTNGTPQRNVGAEALLSADFGRLARIGANLAFSARYMFVDARYVGGPFDGNVVPYAPAHTIVASATFEHPIGISATASWMLVSDQFADATNTRAPTPDGRLGVLPTYNALDLTASYTHRETGLGLALMAKNVLNDRYIASRYPDGILPSGFTQLFLAVRWDH
jgi:Fe(3+) dicitrate transport protein